MPTTQAQFVPPPSQKIPTARPFLGLPMLYVGLGLILAPFGQLLPIYLLGYDSASGYLALGAVALVLAGGVSYLAHRSPAINWWHWLLIALGANLFLAALNRAADVPVFAVMSGLVGAIAGGIAAIVQASRQTTPTPPTARIVAPIVGHTADGQPVSGVPVRERSTNVFAILALVFGILGGVLAIVFGHIALSQIKRTGENGRGLAIAGLILGYVFVAFWLLLVISIASGAA